MTVFFTADTHFGHANIIRHCNRPFGSLQEMDDTLIANWNAVVLPGDTVWFLGDFTLGGVEMAEDYDRRLHGKKHLLWGNHDRTSVRRATFWQSSQYATEISADGVKLTLCHYAMRVWCKSHHGAVMLFGHSHNSLPGSSQSLDVGVDAWAFRPVTMPQIVARLLTLPPYASGDHHIAD